MSNKLFDKSSSLKAFNNLFFLFVDKLISLFPEQDELTQAKQAFLAIKAMNVSLIVKIWYQYVYLPYSEYIISGDLSFFLEKDYQEDLNALPNANEIMKFINTFRHHIRDMDPINKQASIEFLKNLTILSECYNRG